MAKKCIIQITWVDAVIYGAVNKERNLSIVPALKQTIGVLVRETNEGIFIENPKTVDKKTGEGVYQEKTKQKTFLFIPHGMIEKRKYI